MICGHELLNIDECYGKKMNTAEELRNTVVGHKMLVPVLTKDAPLLSA
jgi:hypothetical protein